MTTKFRWTRTDVTRGYELQVDKFLSHFPGYSEIVATHNLTGKSSIILGTEGVERSKQYFDVSMTLHAPGAIFDDLRRMGKAAMEHRHGSVEGFMSPEYRGSDKFYIALTAFHDKSVIPTATLVHELGHLVEEQVRLDTNEVTSSAYNSARQVLRLNGMMCDDEEELHYLANEWVAWVNSIWIANLLDIDLRHSILGMVVDEAAWKPGHNNTVTRSIANLISFVDSKHAVRRNLSAAPTVGGRCYLINAMSAHFFFLASMKKLPVAYAIEKAVARK
jgi:hypothetical protein